MEFSSRKRLCDQFYYLLTKESVCFDRPEYWMSAISGLVRLFSEKRHNYMYKWGKNNAHFVRGLYNSSVLPQIDSSDHGG